MKKTGRENRGKRELAGKGAGLLLLAAVLLVLGIPSPGQAAGQKKILRSRQSGCTTVVEYEPTVLPAGGQFAAQKSSVPVTKTTKAFYKKMREYMLKGKTTFSICYSGPFVSGLGVYDTVLEQMRKLDDKSTSSDGDYLANNIYYIGWSSHRDYKGTTYTFSITYHESASRTKAVTKKVKSVLKKLKVSNMSNAAKIKAIHDYIVNLVSYDTSYQDHSAYGGLVASKHTTVCQGYAAITYKMLTEAGISCRIVSGYANGGSHAWNLVKIGKKWYHLDVTFDDPISYRPVCLYNYFLVGDNTILDDHMLDEVFEGAYKYSASDYNWKKVIKKSGKSADRAVIDW